MLANTELSAKELQDVAQRIKALRRAATEHAVEIGQELLRVKEKLPHGIFVKWVERACEFKIRTAQDLMKLAREAEGDAKLVALMVPSTLRVYLSKTTPPVVRQTILKRLENGECVSRKELYSQISDTKLKADASADLPAVGEELSSSFFTVQKLHKTADNKSKGADGDRARIVAELILQRLTPKDYEFIMEGLSWEVWNRAFVWMRATQILESKRVEVPISQTPTSVS